MGCGASKSRDQEEDEYYEEETRSVQTSARLTRSIITPRASSDEGRLSRSGDKSTIESEKWDTFEIASSERGNTAKDSGYGRERSGDRMIAKTARDVAKSDVDTFGHPNRIHSPTRREQIRSPRGRRESSPRGRRESSPQRVRRRNSIDDRGRRYSPSPNRKPADRQLRRIPSRNYDSDPDDYDRRRRRSFDDRPRGSYDQQQRSRRIEDDFDEGYRSGANSNQKNSNIPRLDRQHIPNRDSTRRQPPLTDQQKKNNPNNRTQPNQRRPHSAPDNEMKRRQADNTPTNKLYQRRPIQSTEQNPRTKSNSIQNQKIITPKHQNNISGKPTGSPKKLATVNPQINLQNSSTRVAGVNHKKGQAPPPWKLSYNHHKPGWSNDYLNTN